MTNHPFHPLGSASKAVARTLALALCATFAMPPLALLAEEGPLDPNTAQEEPTLTESSELDVANPQPKADTKSEDEASEGDPNPAGANKAEGTLGTCRWYVTDADELVIAPLEGTEGTLGDWGDDVPWIDQTLKSARFEGTVHATTCNRFFLGQTELTSVDLTGLDTSAVTNMCAMFDRCYALASLDLSGLDTSSATDMSWMFFCCESLTALDVSGFDTSHVTTMDSMFELCSSLETIDISNFDTSQVANMGDLFADCTSLKTLDVSHMNTSNVTDMELMFAGTAVESLNLSTFDTSKVEDMDLMFRGCEQLKELDTTGWDTSKVLSMQAMFLNCSSLTSLDLSAWNTSHVESMGFMFMGCSKLATLNLSGWNTSSVHKNPSMNSPVKYGMTGMYEGCTSLASFTIGEGYVAVIEDGIPQPTASNDRWWYPTEMRWMTRSAVAKAHAADAQRHAATYLNEGIDYSSVFADVNEDTPHGYDIYWLSQEGISTGYPRKDGKRDFRGTENVKRQDMAAFLYRLAGSPNYAPSEEDKAQFVDVTEDTPHATEIWWLAKEGISTGWLRKDGKREFRGSKPVVRQDMAAFLQRLATHMGIDTTLPAGYQNPFADVTASTPHSEDVLWLASSGISTGWTVGTRKEFRGTTDVKRQDMAAFLHRLSNLREL